MIVDRISTAFSTLPNIQNWLYAVILVFGYALIALPIGIKLNFLQFEANLHWSMVFRISAIAFLMPGILEELVWRVMLIPHPTETIAPALRWFWVGLSLIAFTAYHPLNFWVKHNTFKDPRFIVLAALLGGVCTIAYLESGSVWTPVFVHWAIVVGWLSFLGGYRKIHSSSSH
jgi:predicted Abi (CAAX) family protease